jgi:hypothetical protein
VLLPAPIGAPAAVPMCRSFSGSVAAITRPTFGAADSTLPHTCRYTGVDIVRRAQPWLGQPPAKGERESRVVLQGRALPLTLTLAGDGVGLA